VNVVEMKIACRHRGTAYIIETSRSVLGWILH
jgi:hypothetical protein